MKRMLFVLFTLALVLCGSVFPAQGASVIIPPTEPYKHYSVSATPFPQSLPQVTTITVHSPTKGEFTEYGVQVNLLDKALSTRSQNDTPAFDPYKNKIFVYPPSKPKIEPCKNYQNDKENWYRWSPYTADGNLCVDNFMPSDAAYGPPIRYFAISIFEVNTPGVFVAKMYVGIAPAGNWKTSDAQWRDIFNLRGGYFCMYLKIANEVCSKQLIRLKLTEYNQLVGRIPNWPYNFDTRKKTPISKK